MKLSIAYYISGHGFGHAARQSPVIELLAAQGVRVYVRSPAPGKFFAGPGVEHHPGQYDIGMIQSDALNIDVRASLAGYADFLEGQDDLIAREVAFIREKDVQLIASDMPPIAFEIAARAGLPSVAITHFTWDWIYTHYLDDYPQYRPVVDSITASYGKATLALQMPFAHEFEMFPRVEPVPLLVNALTGSRASIRAELKVPSDHKMALLSMGGQSWGRTDISALRQMTGWTFLVMPDSWEQVRTRPNFRLIPTDYEDYHNLIAAADVVVGKSGGTTTAQCIAYRTPIIYTARGDYRENGLLKDALDRYAHSRFLDRENFEAGAWAGILDSFVETPFDWPPIATNGAEVVARRLLQFG